MRRKSGMPLFRCVHCKRDPDSPSYGRRPNRSVVCRYCRASARAKLRREKLAKENVIGKD